MSESKSDWVAAFKLLFLDATPSIDALDGAAATLHELSTEEFTDVAVAVLDNSGPEPHDTSVCGRRRWLLKNIDSTPMRAWHFDVFVFSGRASKSVELWLCVDGGWVKSSGVQRASLRRMTELQRSDLSVDERRGLIDGRARRVMTWLDRPRGELNPGVI